MKIALAPRGVITVEFPHLVRLVAEKQFDTIYHEHFSYFSLLSVSQIFAAHGLTIFDVEELETHGGSLRIYACHTEDPLRPITPRVDALRVHESEAGLDQLALLDHRIEVIDSRRSAPGRRRLAFWLRHLPGRLPVEPSAQ